MTIRVLAQKGIPQAKVARQPDVSEGTVRYHVRRAGHFSFDWAHPAAGCRVCGRCGYTHRFLANR